jgi:hypothetical protein
MDCCHCAEMDGVCTQASCAVLWAAMRLLGEKIGMCRTRVSAPSVRSGLRVDIDDSAPLMMGACRLWTSRFHGAASRLGLAPSCP